MNKILIISFVTLTFLINNANAQGTTHRRTVTDVNGITESDETHSSWQNGFPGFGSSGSLTYKICRQDKCILYKDEPKISSVEIDGQKYEIRKDPKYYGVRIYHNRPTETINWVVYKNGENIGLLYIKLVSINTKDGSRTYEEEIAFGGHHGKIKTITLGMDLISQEGTIDGIPFSVKNILYEKTMYKEIKRTIYKNG